MAFKFFSCESTGLDMKNKTHFNQTFWPEEFTKRTKIRTCPTKLLPL